VIGVLDSQETMRNPPYEQRLRGERGINFVTSYSMVGVESLSCKSSHTKPIT
jgi:hypothetical protein